MSGRVFDGKKSIMIMRSQSEQEDFRRIKEKLGFKKDIDLVVLCASVALKKYGNDTAKLTSMPSKQKLVDISAFSDRRFYDALLRVYLDRNKDIRDIFEDYFYSGFLWLRQWLSSAGPDVSCELEALSDIWDDLFS